MAWRWAGSGRGTSYSTPIVSAQSLRRFVPIARDLMRARAEQLLVLRAANGRLDAARAFRAAGLGRLMVDRARGDAHGSVQRRSHARLPVTTGSGRDAIGRAWGAMRRAYDRASFRQGHADGPSQRVPDFGRAVFRVDGRRVHPRHPGAPRSGSGSPPRLRERSRFDVPSVGPHGDRVDSRPRTTCADSEPRVRGGSSLRSSDADRAWDALTFARRSAQSMHDPPHDSRLAVAAPRNFALACAQHRSLRRRRSRSTRASAAAPTTRGSS